MQSPAFSRGRFSAGRPSKLSQPHHSFDEPHLTLDSISRFLDGLSSSRSLNSLLRLLLAPPPWLVWVQSLLFIELLPGRRHTHADVVELIVLCLWDHSLESCLGKGCG